MIKIAHIITGLGPGGAETMLCKLLTHMDTSRFQNTVISLTDEGRIAHDIRQLGIPVHSLGLRPGIPHPFGLLRLVRRLRVQQPDIVQTWLYHADLLGLVGGRLAGVPSIAWNVRCTELREEDHSRLLFWLLRLLAYLSRGPQAVVVNSEAGRRVHEKIGYRPRQWVVIPNGFDTERFRPSPEMRSVVRKRLGVPENSFLVGMVARYHAMKDHSTFLNAVSQLARGRGADIRVMLVGQGIDGSNGALVNQIKNLNMQDKVLLLSEREDIPDLMASLDIAVSSSYSEGFSNVIGEAMACGVPCVVTDVGESAYIVGDTGLVVPPRDLGAFASALEQLLSMGTDRRRALGQAARERIISLFSIENIAKEYEKLYCDICDVNNVGNIAMWTKRHDHE